MDFSRAKRLLLSVAVVAQQLLSSASSVKASITAHPEQDEITTPSFGVPIKVTDAYCTFRPQNENPLKALKIYTTKYDIPDFGFVAEKGNAELDFGLGQAFFMRGRNRIDPSSLWLSPNPYIPIFSNPFPI